MLFGCELVLNGYIGQLQHVKIGSPAGAICPPQASQPVPPGLDWEMWLGPALFSPFTPLRIQSHPWYHISDYSLGYIAGWGVRHADSAMQGSGLDTCAGPIEIEAHGLFPKEGLFDNPYRWQLHYTFPGGLTWHWTDCLGDGFGSQASADWPQHRMGITFEGTEGWAQPLAPSRGIPCRFRSVASEGLTWALRALSWGGWRDFSAHSRNKQERRSY